MIQSKTKAYGDVNVLANVHIRRTMSLKMASRIKLFYGKAARFAPRKRLAHFVLSIYGPVFSLVLV